MAAPQVIVRQTPVSSHLPHGFPAKVAFALDPNIDVWEVSVTPFGIDGQEPVNQTTMWNVEYTTLWPRALKSITPLVMTVLYDPVAWGQLLTMVNQVQNITHQWMDGSTLSVWGFLQLVELGEQAEDATDPPTMDLTVMVANMDPDVVTGAPVTYGPSLMATAGTTGYELST